MEPVTALPLIRHDLEPDHDGAERAAAAFLTALGVSTSTLLGRLRSDSRSRQEFLSSSGVVR